MTKRCAALAMAAAFLAFAFAGGDAGAHSDQGLLALTAEAAMDARVVLLVATLKYANDGDVVPNALVTAAASNAAGETTPPLTLHDEGEGRYRGELGLPSDGAWNVTVRSEDPVASASASVTVKTRPPSSTPANRPVDTDDGDDGDDGSNLLVRGGALVAVVAVAGVLSALVRRRRPTRN
jgi:hypothetical protein